MISFLIYLSILIWIESYSAKEKTNKGSEKNEVQWRTLTYTELLDSEEDCLKEGIHKVDFAFKERGVYSFRYNNEWYKQYNTAREAFADLIDKVSGRGTWKKNPWVFIYEFDLID